MNIPHSKPWIIDKDLEAVNVTISTGMIAQGSKVSEFEEQISLYTTLPYCVATSSGTAALVLALLALEIRFKDEVILPTYVCPQVLEAVILVGATPVLCDIGPNWVMTAETVTAKITKHTGAIIAVHVFGIPVDVAQLKNLQIPIIEDCCQSLGAELNHQKVGTFGDLAVFSFQATKCLTTAEGGVVGCKDSNLIAKILAIRQGEKLTTLHRFMSPMSDMQASLGLNQLLRYKDFLQRRREIAAYYFEELAALDILLPYEIRNKSIFFRFPVRSSRDFEMVQQELSQKGIQVRRGVDVLLHRMYKSDSNQFPSAERLFEETISIPIYPALNNGQMRSVIEACQQSF
ncbi:DegT/DnrJ/EryC1/StrS family aminotransferase [Pseudanabaena sp. ABRG5-3]|uniref:DegT/DnrJ/EryC1/StrS family aminotransferase n=1 Tax=Pseudanabaena sp. ABRG5-3 TaxID=685565 RepID=UPI000DC6FFA1|nr:DegT/DnrJ/EryC1/StrS family aminotransferase [Pseudanabaena sp. ABRG5-3]BBC22732.1 perosamine synthetase [Pseudanabaena sp. ABRG5-3]